MADLHWQYLVQIYSDKWLLSGGATLPWVRDPLQRRVGWAALELVLWLL
jgi:hypothetical protein